MHAASRVLAPAPTSCCSARDRTMLRSSRPVIAVGATRTGAGKSQTTRYLADPAAERGHHVGRRPPPDALRRPRRPAGASASRPTRTSIGTRRTIEEREEYEPHLDAGRRRLRGVDYEAILRAGRARGRRHPLGRRQQRLPVLPARPATSSSPTRSARRRAPLPPGRDEPADGRRRASSTRSTRPTPERSSAVRRLDRASSTPDAAVVAARSDRRRSTAPSRSRASASSSSRTARRSPTAGCVRRRRRRRRRFGAARARRPAAGRRRARSGEVLRALPDPRAARPGDGLRRRPDPTSWRRRSTRVDADLVLVGDADRPDPGPAPQQADHAGSATSWPRPADRPCATSSSRSWR